jgi:hypothetical protein
MKKSIALGALCLLLSIGACSTATAKPKHHYMNTKAEVSLIPLREKPGFAVRVDKLEAGKSMVLIYNNNGDEVFKNLLTKKAASEKKYILSDLPAGNYTLEVYSKGHDLKTKFYVYDKHQRKVIFLV